MYTDSSQSPAEYDFVTWFVLLIAVGMVVIIAYLAGTGLIGALAALEVALEGSVPIPAEP